MKRLFFCLFFFPFFTYSQVNKDSLINLWENSTVNKERLSSVKKIIWDVYMNTQPDSAFYYGELMYELAKKNDNKKYMAIALESQGVSYVFRGSLSKAISLFEKSLELYKVINQPSSLSKIYDFLATTHFQIGNYEISIKLFEKALKIAEENGYEARKCSLYGNIGNVYQKQGKISLALEQHFKSLFLSKKLKKISNQANAYLNIAGSYKLIGKRKKALEYYMKSMNINKKNNLDNYLVGSLYALGDFYLTELNYDKALYYHNKSLAKAIEINSSQEIISNECNIAIIYLKKGNHVKAKEKISNCLKSAIEIKNQDLLAEVYFTYAEIETDLEKQIMFAKKSFQLAQKIGRVLLLKKASFFLYEKHKKSNNTQNALKMYEFFVKMRDSLLIEENNRSRYQHEYVQKLRMDSLNNSNRNKLQTAKINRKESELQNQRLVKQGLIYGILSIFFIMFLIIRNSKNIKKHQKKEYESLLDQIQLLKSKTNIQSSSSIFSESEVNINKEKINALSENKLNDTDWKILNLICITPTITNKDIGEKVYLSVDGVKSSFKKMYDLFDITSIGRNKKISLAIKVIKLSEE